MYDIAKFPFNEDDLQELKNSQYWKNWPIVYLLEWKNEVYIGETIDAYNRSKQHLKKEERKKLHTIHIISDEKYNKSAALDIESWLIQYMSADGKYQLQNWNWWLRNHDYYDRALYRTKFWLIREELRKKAIVTNTLADIRNSDIFKYSPYKSLSPDQYEVVEYITSVIERKQKKSFIVHWKPWTGKTIVWIYLMKFLKQRKETEHLSIWLVVPVTPLRATIKKVFTSMKWLSASMVIWPNDVVKKHYDILIVDEAHRLKQRKNLTGYGAFDKTNKKLWLIKEEWTELDWVKYSSNVQIFLYDEWQSVKPSDVKKSAFKNLHAEDLILRNQLRVAWWEEYIATVENLFDVQVPKSLDIKNYDFKIFDDFKSLHNAIKEKNKEHGLSRMVAWFAWKWTSKNDKTWKIMDITLDGYAMRRNSTLNNRVHSKNALNEVWCIHTVQWYDLNYAWVIIGWELQYDRSKNELFIDKNNYFDTKWKAWVKDNKVLKSYIINIYKTLMTRGIQWTYLYIVDRDLREYVKNYFWL